MVKKLNWNELFVKEFKYRAGMFNFMFLTFNAKSYKSDKTKCSKCCNSQHKMETILFECKASECNYNYKCVHEVRYIRYDIIEEIALPGMVAHTRLINKRREKVEKELNLNVESDDEFATNINAIESQAINEIVNKLPTQSSQTAVVNVEQPKKKRGRKKKEQLPRALEKSPEIQPVRRSQRNKK